MRKLLACCCLSLLPGLAWGWGYKGHEVVGYLADQRLTPAARTALKEITRSPSLAYLANWADTIRDDHPETATWHYVNIPDDAAAFEMRFVPKSGCVVDRIEWSAKVLGDRSKSRQERLDALRWLVHLVGDIHQPLHCSREEDHGGNRIHVTFAGRDMNLHSLWDTELVEWQKLAARAYAAQLSRDIRPQDAETWSTTDVGAWATESLHLARKKAYQDERGATIRSGDHIRRSYMTTRTVIVDEQLKKAGVRLALLINRALGE